MWLILRGSRRSIASTWHQVGSRLTTTKVPCMVPMHTTPAAVTALQGILGCQVRSFPQTYLGLPLGDTKLRLSPFAPLISMDRYLGGWPNPMGWAVLVNTVRQQTGMERIGYTGRDAYLPGKTNALLKLLHRLHNPDDSAWARSTTWSNDCSGILARRKQKFRRNALLHVNLKKKAT
jgi:hypothetical protein